MTILHRIHWDKPAKLILANSVVPFGDGYRQISGPTIAEGAVDELVARVRAMPSADARKAYILNDGGVPLTLQEIDAQPRDSDG